MSNLPPHIYSVELSALDFKKYEIFAVPLSQVKEKPVFSNKEFKKSLEKSFNLDLSKSLLDWPDFKGKSGEIIEIPISKKGYKATRVYLVGTGSEEREDLRKAGISLARKVKTNGVKVATGLTQDKALVSSHVMSLILASYIWNQKSEKAKAQSDFTLVGRKADLAKAISHGIDLATGVWQARDLIHTPANIKNPLWMAQQAKTLLGKVKNSGLSIEVKSGAQLKEFGGLVAVGNSSPNPGPRFIQIKYRPSGASRAPHVVLVGKGITFDTGGVSLKRPYDIMAPMKSDMSGAAAVLATLLTVAKLGVKVNVTGLLMCAENAISATAQRPSDVIKHYGGTTVEVLDTDAEGRLVLADGLAFADINLKPDYLVDIATLTGSATLGLGRQYGAMYTRNDKLANSLSKIGERVGEKVWHMPLIDDYKIAMRSDIADFNHLADKEDFSAGSVTAALFLEHFAGKVGAKGNWIHLDIAGVARSEGDSGENPKGGTGFGVRLLSEWIASLP